MPFVDAWLSAHSMSATQQPEFGEFLSTYLTNLGSMLQSRAGQRLEVAQ